MSTDTIVENEESFVSNTDAIIYAASDISGWTHSLISDHNIPNSSSSTSVDEHQQQQQISIAACDDDDSIALCNNTCGGSELHGGLLPDTE
ncbi:hypothetical protein KY285_005566 [Solanum tuberosum]|nr:hypothetical protein KY284_005721 [Solanum tuberosum]KAH0752418.1 hypothetical protein KY285_005566 [Solanum tuberosum]